MTWVETVSTLDEHESFTWKKLLNFYKHGNFQDFESYLTTPITESEDKKFR